MGVEFIDAAKELLDRLPDTGLIIDLRYNPGGFIWAQEMKHVPDMGFAFLRQLQMLQPQFYFARLNCGNSLVSPMRHDVVAHHERYTRAVDLREGNLSDL